MTAWHEHAHPQWTADGTRFYSGGQGSAWGLAAEAASDGAPHKPPWGSGLGAPWALDLSIKAFILSAQPSLSAHSVLNPPELCVVCIAFIRMNLILVSPAFENFSCVTSPTGIQFKTHRGGRHIH